MKSKFPAFVVLLVGTLLLACGEDTVNTCDLWTSSAIVSGQLTYSDSSEPIPDAELEILVADSDQCSGAEQWISSLFVMTDKDGLFRAELELGNQKGFRCVGVRETDSGAIATDIVEFIGGCGDTRTPEELTLNISI